MNKILALILFSSLASFSSNNVIAAENRDSCVIQVLKNNSNSVRANFIFACGSELIAQHEIDSFDVTEDVEAVKNIFRQALKETVGQGEDVTCFETDSDLYWIAICHK